MRVRHLPIGMHTMRLIVSKVSFRMARAYEDFMKGTISFEGRWLMGAHNILERRKLGKTPQMHLTLYQESSDQ